MQNNNSKRQRFRSALTTNLAAHKPCELYDSLSVSHSERFESPLQPLQGSHSSYRQRFHLHDEHGTLLNNDVYSMVSRPW